MNIPEWTAQAPDACVPGVGALRDSVTSNRNREAVHHFLWRTDVFAVFAFIFGPSTRITGNITRRLSTVGTRSRPQLHRPPAILARTSTKPTSFLSTIPISSRVWSLNSGPTSNSDPVTWHDIWKSMYKKCAEPKVVRRYGFKWPAVPVSFVSSCLIAEF